MMDAEDLWVPLLMFVAVVGLIFLGAWAWKHPCIKYKERTCTTNTCVWQQGRNGQCLQWESHQYTCQECVERKP